MFTVSNKKGATRLYLHLFAIIFLLFTFNVQSQNLSRHYASSVQENGILYYILPQEGFQNKTQKSKFVYDITYLTTQDSATVNFSYFDKSNLKIENLLVQYSNLEIFTIPERLYIETKGKNWHYRYSFKMLYSDLVQLFNESRSPEFILNTDQGPILLKIKSGTWQKQSAIIKKILSLIEQNR